MQPGDLLWTPGPERIRRANVTAFADWLARERGRRFADYTALWRWSVEDLEGCWQALWDYFHIDSSAPHTRALRRRSMPGAEWFPGAPPSYPQHVIGRAPPRRAVPPPARQSHPPTARTWAAPRKRLP